MSYSHTFTPRFTPRARWAAAWLAVACTMATTAAFAQVAPPSTAPAPVEDSMAQRMRACTACHGQQGRAGPDGYYPRLAGKPAAYLYHQLLNFRDGRRHYGPMTRLVDTLSDAYLLDIAQHFASLQAPYSPPAVPASLPGASVLARGQHLALHGDAALRLPACAQCHGSALTGALPHVPGLLGLSSDYLLAQLGGWKIGQRRAHAPDCMASVAQRLSDADAYAVVTWLSLQPMPADPRPAPAMPGPASADMPDLACGAAPSPRGQP